MTKREAAIISAYTGFLIGDFNDFQNFVSEIMKRPVFTHELCGSFADEIQEKAKSYLDEIIIDD